MVHIVLPLESRQFDPATHSALDRGWCWTNNGNALAKSSTVSGRFESSLFQLHYDNITGTLSATHVASGTTRTITNINAANTMNEEIFPFVNLLSAGTKVQIVSELK